MFQGGSEPPFSLVFLPNEYFNLFGESIVVRIVSRDFLRGSDNGVLNVCCESCSCAIYTIFVLYMSVCKRNSSRWFFLMIFFAVVIQQQGHLVVVRAMLISLQKFARRFQNIYLEYLLRKSRGGGIHSWNRRSRVRYNAFLWAMLLVAFGICKTAGPRMTKVLAGFTLQCFIFWILLEIS